MADTTNILVLFIISLLISSSIIAYIVAEKENETLERVIPPEQFGLTRTHDFKLGNFSSSIVSTGEYQYMQWRYIDNIGYSSPDNPLMLDEGIFFLRKVVGENGIYDFTYVINNTVHSQFNIEVRYTSSNLHRIVLHFNNDGIHKLFLGRYWPDYSYTYPNINEIENISVRCILNENDNTLAIYVKENYLDTIDVPTNWGNLLPTEYGGIKAEKEGLIVENLEITTESLDLDYSSYLGILLAVLAWNVSPEYLPFWLNIILIKSQIFAIIICLVIIIRG